MRKYKLVLLLKSGTKKEAKDKLLQDLKKWIGSVKEEKVTELGERKLAYQIKKQRSGEYVVFDFQAENLPKDLDKRILMQDDILRHLIVRV